MKAYQRNKKLKDALGINRIQWSSDFRNKSLWYVTLLNGNILTIWTHRLSTETGVLRQCAELLKDEKVKYD